MTDAPRIPRTAAVVGWWDAQTARARVGLAVAALFALAGMLNVTTAGFGRATSARPSSASASSAPSSVSSSTPVLSPDSAPADPAKTWSVTKIWQGSGSTETEAFTVAEHWRLDWIFSPAPAGGILQVYIYHADGRLLMNLAANNQRGGADSSFWLGAGTYFLKVNSTGGDWKVAVQDLH